VQTENSDESDFDFAGDGGSKDKNDGKEDSGFDSDGERSEFDLDWDVDPKRGNGGQEGQDDDSDSSFDLAGDVDVGGSTVGERGGSDSSDEKASLDQRLLMKDMRSQRMALDKREVQQRALEEEELAALDLTLSTLNAPPTPTDLKVVPIDAAVPVKEAQAPQLPEPSKERKEEEVPQLKALVLEQGADNYKLFLETVGFAHVSDTKRPEKEKEEPVIEPQAEVVVVLPVELVVPVPATANVEAMKELRHSAVIAQQERQSRREKRDAAQRKLASSRAIRPLKANAPPSADHSMDMRRRIERDRARRGKMMQEAQEEELREKLSERQRRTEVADRDTALAEGKIKALEQTMLEMNAQQEAHRAAAVERLRELEEARVAREAEVASLLAARKGDDGDFKQKAVATMSSSLAAETIVKRKQDEAARVAAKEQSRARKEEVQAARVEMEAAEAKKIETAKAQEDEKRRQRQEGIARSRVSTEANLKKAGLNKQRMEVKMLAAHGTKQPSFTVAPYGHG
jgi:hypothetical protein